MAEIPHEDSKDNDTKYLL